MEVLRAGYNYRHPGTFKVNRPAGSGDYLLLMIKTESFAVINGTRVEIPANCALIFKKGTPQFYGGASDKFINDWMHFDMNEEELKEFDEYGVPFDTVIPLNEVVEISGFVKNIVFERYSQNAHKNASIKRYFDLILFKLSEKLGDNNPDREHPLYERFCNLRNEILLEPQKTWGIDDICKGMMLSRSYVQHLYKLFFETSISADVKRGRIDRAKYLLSASNMTVSAVSDACGYESDVHFMRVFKTETSLTPSEYRNEFKILRA